MPVYLFNIDRYILYICIILTLNLPNCSARFFSCNVADYESQAQMFRDVLEWAPGGPRVINCVIVNAGVSEVGELIVRDDNIGK